MLGGLLLLWVVVQLLLVDSRAVISIITPKYFQVEPSRSFSASGSWGDIFLKTDDIIHSPLISA